MSSLAWLAVALGLVLSFNAVTVDSYQPNERVSSHDSNRFDVQVYGGVTTKPFGFGKSSFNRSLVNITFIDESSSIKDFLVDVCSMTTRLDFNVVLIFGYGAPGLTTYCQQITEEGSFMASFTTFGNVNARENESKGFDVQVYGGASSTPFNIGSTPFDRNLTNLTFIDESTVINDFLATMCVLVSQPEFNVIVIYGYRSPGWTPFCDRF